MPDHSESTNQTELLRMNLAHFKIELNEESPLPEVVKPLLKAVKSNTNLLDFGVCLNILELIEREEESRDKRYKQYDEDLYQLLLIYKKKLPLISRSLSKNQCHILTQFFNDFIKSEKIKQLRNTKKSWTDLLSTTLKLKELIFALDKLNRRFIHLVGDTLQETEHDALVQLLFDKLEGKSSKPIIEAPIGLPKDESLTFGSQLLPESEFQPLYGQPEHPDMIGISDTMSAMGSSHTPEQMTVCALFSTKNLKKDFLDAFPWATDFHSIEELEQYDILPEENLLGTDDILPPETQMIVMRYVLVALDTIGKAAGEEGVDAILNINYINKITKGLQELATLLTEPILNAKDFQNTLTQMTENFTLLDKQFYAMKRWDPELNHFCHVNEFLAHKHMNLPYEKHQSPLVP